MGKFINETGVSEQNFEEAVDFMCNKTSLFKEACNQIDSWGKSNVYWWIKNGKSQILCSRLEFCQATVSAAHFWFSERECQVCTYLVEAVESWMNSNSTISMIARNLNVVCELVPSFYNTCELFVDHGLPQIINWITRYVADPNSVCKELEVCTSGESETTSNNNYECALCMIIVNTLEHWIEENVPRDKIKEKFEQVCSLIPSFEKQCDAIMEQGLDEFLDWIEEEENPKVVCRQMNFCDSKLPVIISAM